MKTGFPGVLTGSENNEILRFSIDTRCGPVLAHWRSTTGCEFDSTRGSEILNIFSILFLRSGVEVNRDVEFRN